MIGIHMFEDSGFGCCIGIGMGVCHFGWDGMGWREVCWGGIVGSLLRCFVEEGEEVRWEVMGAGNCRLPIRGELTWTTSYTCGEWSALGDCQEVVQVVVRLFESIHLRPRFFPFPRHSPRALAYPPTYPIGTDSLHSIQARTNHVTSLGQI